MQVVTVCQHAHLISEGTGIMYRSVGGGLGAARRPSHDFTDTARRPGDTATRLYSRSPAVCSAWRQSGGVRGLDGERADARTPRHHRLRCHGGECGHGDGRGAVHLILAASNVPRTLQAAGCSWKPRDGAEVHGRGGACTSVCHVIAVVHVAMVADARVEGHVRRQNRGCGLHPGAGGHATHVGSSEGGPEKMGGAPGPCKRQEWHSAGAQGPVMSVGHIWGVYSPPELTLDLLHPPLSTPGRAAPCLSVCSFIPALSRRSGVSGCAEGGGGRSKRWRRRASGGGDDGGGVGQPGRCPAAAGRRDGGGWCREMMGERKKEINRTRRARFERSRDFPNITDHRRKTPHMRHAGCTGHPAALYIPGGHGNVVPIIPRLIYWGLT